MDKVIDETHKIIRYADDFVILCDSQVEAEAALEKSGVGASTIKRMETFEGIPSSRVENLQAIKDTFVATGKVRFEKDTCVCVDE